MRAAVLSSMVVLGTLMACSAGRTGNSGGAGSGGGAIGTGGDIGLGGGFDTGGTTPGSGCSQAATLVYVLSESNEIWSFDPPAKKFTKLFTLTCDTPNDGNTWMPNSMAIDRDANAWVNYVGTYVDPLMGTATDVAGRIYKVDIDTKQCESAPAITLPSAAWYRLGMGYSTDASGGTSETLYVTGTAINDIFNPQPGPGLGKIDMANHTLVPVGQFTGVGNELAGQSAELTGTGDAKLYGFFTFLDPFGSSQKPVHVAEINKADGSTPPATDVTLPSVMSPMAWAFSFWGGELYLYTSDGMSSSRVVHYVPSTKAVDTQYVPDAGIIIVGAGVSTCAPIKPPA